MRISESLRKRGKVEGEQANVETEILEGYTNVFLPSKIVPYH